jgi:flagellar M-ring protein FliF
MDQMKRLVGMLSMGQRIAILLVGLMAGAGIMYFTRWERESSFHPLYASLSQEDASAVVQKLKEGSVPYRLNGSAVEVPEEKIAELRLEMAGAGLPKTGRIGFEIFDKTNFGMTDFAEKVNYRRAVEGELERSVMSMAEVEQARVHITFPKESVFIDSREAAKASVLIKIRPSMALPDSAIPSITHLVASAVEGLGPEAVSVMDMRGNLLNKARHSAGGDASEATLEYRRTVEQDLAAKLESTLEPLVGAGRFRAAVSADCDMTSGEQNEENYDPTHSVMVTSQKTEDTSSMGVAAGIPGTASNLPQPSPKPAGTSNGTSRRTESINYQTSRTVRRTVLPLGAIKRLSVSILIDHEVHFEGKDANAKRVLVPPAPERLKSIHDLAAAAIGFNPQRGDQLIVESLPFESTLNMEPPGSATPAPVGSSKKQTPLEQLKGDPKLLIGVAVAVVVVLAGLGFLVRMMRKPKEADLPAATQTAALPPASDRIPALESPGHEYAVPAGGGTALTAPAMPGLTAGKAEALANRLREMGQKDAELSAGVLRGWLKEERI